MVEKCNDWLDHIFNLMEKRPILCLLAIALSYAIVFLMGWIP